MAWVELIYIPPASVPVQRYIPYVAPMTIADVLQQSGVLRDYPEIAHLTYGIFARVVNKDAVVNAGDRIECYRPLVRDPKETRRIRAKG